MTDDGKDLIGKATSVNDIITALAGRGCSDLTSLIDITACSNLPLAGGGFCDVFRGEMSQGTSIAIKSLRLYDRPGSDCDVEKARVLKRAARELYHWSKLRHPNVLPLIGLAMFRGQMSMISEWMVNGDLMSYVRVNPDANKISLCMDVCAGLSYIHSRGMIHGDLKAANVMVSLDGTAMIADFGNSQLRDLTLKFTNTTNASFSVRWAAPELLLGDSNPQLTKKVDVYAYGMTVLETLTGKVPCEGLSEQQVMFRVVFQRKAPAHPGISLSNDFWDILQYCWTWEHSKRPDIKSVRERLESSIQPPAQERRSDSGMVQDFHAGNQANRSLPELDDECPLERANDRHGFQNSRLVEPESLDVKSPRARVHFPGKDRSETLEAMAEAATRYFQQGRLANAESLELKVVGARQRVLGQDHPKTLQSIANLATTYFQQGRLADAERLEVAVVAAQKRVLGDGHPDTLESMANLMMTYMEQGRLEEAESLGVQVWGARKIALGEEHPDTLLSMANLALAYYKRGRLGEAEFLAVNVVAAQKRVLGEDHVDTLQSITELATRYFDQGRLKEAELLDIEVLSARKRTLGEDHPNTLQSLTNLATTYFQQGRIAEAESLGVNMSASWKQMFGEELP